MQSKKKNLYAFAWKDHWLDKIHLRAEWMTAKQARTINNALRRARSRGQICEFTWQQIEGRAIYGEFHDAVPGTVRRRETK